MRSISLKKLEGSYVISRLGPADGVPPWADGEGFVSISRTEDELSIVCLQSRVPAGTRQDPGWTCFRLVGPFAFGETGIVLSVIQPLSKNGIGIFVVSTFDSDHLLVKLEDADRARILLVEAGHQLI
jgi:hypothetical protein